MLIMQFIIFGLFIYYNGKVIELIKNFTYSNESVPNSNEQLNLNESTPLLKQELTCNGIGNEEIKNEIKENPSVIYETVEEEKEEKEEKEENSWFYVKIFYNFITIPILMLYKWTLPKPSDRTFVLTFIISIIWMTGLSYITILNVEFISKKLT